MFEGVEYMDTNYIKSVDLCEVCLWTKICYDNIYCKDCDNFNKEKGECRCFEIKFNTPCDMFIKNPVYFCEEE